MVFVNSMSDLFHPSVPEAFIRAVFEVMAASPQHVFQILTKRPRRMASLLNKWIQVLEPPFFGRPLENVWLGVSVEDQKWAEQRIPLLLNTPAQVRFLSCEPLLGAVDLTRWLFADDGGALVQFARRLKLISRGQWTGRGEQPAIHWVIVGGESGANHRVMEADWVREIRDQCVRSRVPFFFKQWGGRTSKAGGRELDGRLWDEMPIENLAAKYEGRFQPKELVAQSPFA
jgi:protein gp37